MRVTDAILSTLKVGDVLCTPTGRSSFVILKFNSKGITVSKLTQLLWWSALEAVPAFMAARGGEVKIGAVKGWAKPCTLERLLQNEHSSQMMRSSYAAPILDAADICKILPKRGRDAQRIRLMPRWWP